MRKRKRIRNPVMAEWMEGNVTKFYPEILGGWMLDQIKAGVGTLDPYSRVWHVLISLKTLRQIDYTCYLDK